MSTHAPLYTTTKNKHEHAKQTAAWPMKIGGQGDKQVCRQAGVSDKPDKGAAEVSERRDGGRKSRRSTTWNSSSNKSSSGREMMRRSSLARMCVRKGTLAWGMECVSCKKSAAVLGPSNLQAHNTPLVYRAWEHPLHTLTHFKYIGCMQTVWHFKLFKAYAACGRQNMHIQGLETHCLFPPGLLH